MTECWAPIRCRTESRSNKCPTLTPFSWFVCVFWQLFDCWCAANVACLCCVQETLRLHPSVPSDSKTALGDDVLPVCHIFSLLPSFVHLLMSTHTPSLTAGRHTDQAWRHHHLPDLYLWPFAFDLGRRCVGVQTRALFGPERTLSVQVPDVQVSLQLLLCVLSVV